MGLDMYNVFDSPSIIASTCEQINAKGFNSSLKLHALGLLIFLWCVNPSHKAIMYSTSFIASHMISFPLKPFTSTEPRNLTSTKNQLFVIDLIYSVYKPICVFASRPLRYLTLKALVWCKIKPNRYREWWLVTIAGQAHFLCRAVAHGT